MFMKHGIAEILLLVGSLLMVIASVMLVSNSYVADPVSTVIRMPGTQAEDNISTRMTR
jgi:hypothetical protein